MQHALLHLVNHEELHTRYRNAKPFPHLVIDDFLGAGLAADLENECREIALTTNSSNGFTQVGKLTLNSWTLMPPLLQHVCSFFQSGAFIEHLEAITGLPGLIADPHLEGGGLHRTERSGFLKMHTDFNFNARLRLHRRLNVLYFLNSGYQPCWGGELLLSRHPSREATAAMKAISPCLNRLVIFNTNDTTFHGHPEPHAFPAGFPRTSLAFYYYTATRPWYERRRMNTSTTRYLPCRDQPIAARHASLRSRLGYQLRRWTPFG